MEFPVDKDLRILAVIPARGGSKRLPRKNVLPLGGKPLIEWTISAAIASGVIHKTVVSSDDEEILSISRQSGVATRNRPDTLASDTASTVDVVLDVIEAEEEVGNYFDVVVLLQPTSPLRSAEDISKAYHVWLKNGESTLVSVCETDHPVEWCGEMTGDGYFAAPGIGSGRRSQEYSPSYRLNGAIYISPISLLKIFRGFFHAKPLGYIMSRTRSIDVDVGIDLELCEFMVKRFLNDR
jgi:CMP-N,N'-diacetyllegionaminic acid synthase